MTSHVILSWEPGWYRGLPIHLDLKLVPELGMGFFYWVHWRTMPSNVITIRKINENDAADYRAVRLRALKEHPDAYGATLQSMESQSVEAVAERLRTTSPEGFCLFGAFVNDGANIEVDELVGLAGFGRSHDNPKQRHRAGIFQMYVAPEYRGRQLGLKLLDAALEYAHQQDGLEEVVLAVTVGNETARGLYIKAGFRPTYIEPRYLKIDDTYYDIEWMVLKL